MKAFNEESFTELLTDCNNNAGYKGMIILLNLAEVRQFMREIVELHKANPISGVKAIRTGLNVTPRILFDNNSTIDIMVSRENLRGARYNDILCSTPFEPSVLDMVRDLEIDYRTDWHKEYSCEWKQPGADPMDNITDTAELDNFLNGFAVNS